MEAKVTLFSTKKTLNLRGNLLDLTHPLVMGIVNNTPDSFYDGGSYHSDEGLKQRIETIAGEGVDIIDIGGYSSRPGATEVSDAEEHDRVLQALEIAREVAPHIPISIDTFRAKVAQAAVDRGADMINDISGGNLDESMFDTIAKLRVPYVLMHMKGTPHTMNSHTDYQYLITEIAQYFVTKLRQLTSMGVKDIILDPGFGFAKTAEQSYQLLKELQYFKVLNQPIMAGVSRKSMIYRSLGITPERALNGTSVLNTIALLNGASILRVHDVAAAREVVELYKLTYR